MSRRLSRISIVLTILLSGEVWAVGLGEIRLESALNEPFRAEIELLSATPEEIGNLQIGLASAETFDRYGIDRPVYLQNIQFQVIQSGRIDGNIIELRSATPMTEPFLTFLVEASWARGRLLREYTVLLDPPTFRPPSASEPAPAVTAPIRTAPADSGRIERAAPPPQPAEAVPAPRVAQPAPRQEPVVDDSPYESTAGADYYVQRGDTLWGIAQRVRPDSRLSMNQTMLAIFEANPEAFGGNINLLRAGASLRIPSADQIFRINRGDALNEVQRQHSAWGSGTVPVADDTTSRPSLTLVPPDEEYVDDGAVADDLGDQEPLTREQEIEQRINELMLEVPEQQSLIEIRDNELAALREELARIRGEVYEPPVDDTVTDATDEDLVDDQLFVDDDEIMVDDAVVEDVEPVPDEAVDEDVADEPPPVRARRQPEPSLVDQALEILTNFWTIVVAALVIVGGLLFWFMRRGGDDVEPESWRPLDADDAGGDDLTATESMRAPTPTDDSFVVVEQDSAQLRMDDTVDAPAPDFDVSEASQATVALGGVREPTGEFGSLEDTFSSETAVNLDQTDPIAEADFHMAYGLYDQAADLVNGALEMEPRRADLLTKLCEIYFVWGNRDAFVDAAGRLKATVGGADSADWDKIVIMGQQIAADDQLFAGAEVAGATKAVDLSFEAGMDETGSLDMELVAESGATSNVIDLGSAGADDTAASSAVMDFDLGGAESADYEDATVEFPPADLDTTAETRAVDELDFDVTAEMPSAERTVEMPPPERTVEMPTPESTVETPTIEQQFEELSGTAELPSLDATLGGAIRDSGMAADQTAEINLDDLGLDLDGLEETDVASLDDFGDLDATGETDVLSDTGINEALADTGDVTGKNPEVDPNATGVQTALSEDDTGINEAIHIATDVDIDDSLLDATGLTQVIPKDLAVDTATDIEADLGDEEETLLASGYGDSDTARMLADDQETMVAGLDDDAADDDYDFAKTEALPADIFTGDASLDETGELPAIGSTSVDLDLDDLTAALQVSNAGDTVEQLRDDATVEQPRPGVVDVDDTGISTMALDPEELSDDLHDARTMTEVGTKLDLARAYVDMGDPAGARSILEEVLDEGDEGQRQQAQQLLNSLPS